MANFGMKVLLHDKYPDADVKTATPKQLAWSSQYRHLMVHKMGIATATGQTIPNELGYRTGTAFYFKKSGTYISGGFGGMAYQYHHVATDTFGKFNSRADQYLVGAAGGAALPYPMVYVCYANALDPTEFGNYLDGTKDVGMKMGTDEYGIHVPEGQIRLSSKFRPVQIIAAGTLTVNLAARAGSTGAQPNDQTGFADFVHGRGQANHVIFRRESGYTGNWFYWPAPTGISGGMPYYGFEASIDATRLRFRASRNVVGYFDGSTDQYDPLPAESYNLTYYLTNIPLPA